MGKRVFLFVLLIGVFLCGSAFAADLSNLTTLIQEAKTVDLSGYPAKYADPVKHTLAKAEKIAANAAATEDQVNIARLELQVALNTLVIDLQLATVLDMHELVKAGKLTYAGLAQMYLTRIELYDVNFNKLNAVRVLNPNALTNAQACDAAFAQNPGLAKGMFGIPVMLKDNINFMGLPTTAGSIALADNYAPYDSPLVTNLKNAGAVMLGKLNMTELAHGVSWVGTGVNGFSSLGRRVYSAYRPNALTAHGSTISRLDPSGSSSGSAVAASAALAAVTIGTETTGSIISPSQSNFLVGIKPTVGLISRHGVIPLSDHWDTPGPIVRNVTDAAILLTDTYGYDPNDAETEGILTAGLTGFDFSECLKPGFLQGKRFGVMSIPGATAAARPAFDAALNALVAAGATIVYQTNGSVLPSISINSSTAGSSDDNLLFRYKMSFPVYLATLDPNYKWYNKTLPDIYDYMLAEFQANPAIFRDSLAPNLDVEFLGRAARNEVNEVTLARFAGYHAEELRQGRTEGIDKRLADYNLDGLLGSGSLTSVTARTGYPHMTIPIFRTAGTQLTGGSHMYFAGTAFSEPVLIAAAYVAEQATKARDNTAPGLAYKTDLGSSITYARALTAAERAPFLAIYNAAVAAYSSDFTIQMDADKADSALRIALITSVALDKTEAGLYVGGTDTLSATVAPAIAEQSVTWSSSDPAIAGVVATGNSTAAVTGLTTGTAIITAAAADGEHIATCTVTVTIDPSNKATICGQEIGLAVDAGGLGWSWFAATNTLTLTGGYNDFGDIAFVTDNNITIQVTGNTTAGSIVNTGTGSLSITGNQGMRLTLNAAESPAISVKGDIVIDSGEIYALTAKDNANAIESGGSVTVKGSAKVTAETGVGEGSAISAAENITISTSGSVKATVDAGYCLEASVVSITNGTTELFFSVSKGGGAFNAKPGISGSSTRVYVNGVLLYPQAVPSAVVEKLTGNKNNLTITVIEKYADGITAKIEKTFSIDNNAAGTYVVGVYKVYVDTKGNTQIRACYIVD